MPAPAPLCAALFSLASAVLRPGEDRREEPGAALRKSCWSVDISCYFVCFACLYIFLYVCLHVCLFVCLFCMCV